MTVTDDEVTSRLAGVWPGAAAGPPRALAGGYWASMHRVPVTGQPEGVAPEVVVRFAPHRTMGAKEAEVQRAVAAQGFPTPQVWVSEDDEGRDGWWSVMDFSPGSPLLDGLDGAAALRRAPSILRTLPVELARAMHALHRLDPAPVSAAVERVAPEAAWSAAAVLDQLRLGAGLVGRADVVTALDRLERDLPAPQREVLCHGDLHPFNVLDRHGELVVLDWTGAVVADPCFDIAFTKLLLSNPPLQLPRSLRPVARAAGRALARRFVASYTRLDPDISLEHLDWFEALHSARILVETAAPAAPGHPLVLVAPAAVAQLAAFTGVDVAS